MNKAALKKNVGHHMRIRPMANRFVGGPSFRLLMMIGIRCQTVARQ